LQWTALDDRNGYLRNRSIVWASGRNTFVLDVIFCRLHTRDMNNEPSQPSTNITSTKQVTCPECPEMVTLTQVGRSTSSDRPKLVEGVDYTVSLSCGHDANNVK